MKLVMIMMALSSLMVPFAGAKPFGGGLFCQWSLVERILLKKNITFCRLNDDPFRDEHVEQAVWFARATNRVWYSFRTVEAKEALVDALQQEGHQVTGWYRALPKQKLVVDQVHHEHSKND